MMRGSVRRSWRREGAALGMRRAKSDSDCLSKSKTNTSSRISESPYPAKPCARVSDEADVARISVSVRDRVLARVVYNVDSEKSRGSLYASFPSQGSEST